MIWDSIRGQSQAVAFLRQSAAAGRLAHALLFTGPPGVGKGLTARLLAMALFCERSSDSRLDACGQCRSCRLMEAGTHPDFLTVACPEGKSELPIELLVGSLDNRGREGLCHDLSLRPMVAPRRVAVIDDADRMSTEGANAILKTLEEPPSYAIIILLAADLGKILPTIRSRCQIVRFNPLSVADVAELLSANKWTESPDEAQAAAEISGGSLTVAQQVLDPQLRAVRQALFAQLSKPQVDAFTIAKTLLEGLDGLGGDTQRQRTNARWIVRFAVELLRKRIRDSCDGYPEAIGATETLGRAIERCIDAEEQIDANASIPLCLEALAGDLAAILNACAFDSARHSQGAAPTA
ncbi:MAG TPA: DNA polymerase III subunit delta' [Planctomycetaceae bacterium]|nr:DNA polymerase III subunit delta' [Planctomycetaceae bacterium]